MCGWSFEGGTLKFDCGFKFVGTKRVAQCSWSSDGYGSFQIQQVKDQAVLEP
jgi:hypothetical protein